MTNYMKILFSITYYHPYISGLTLAASRWAEGLADMGNDVTVMCMQHDQSLPILSHIQKVRVRRVPWFVKISKGFLSFDWLLQSWKNARVCDVVVIHLPQFEGLVVALVARLLGKRVISVYHCEVVLPKGQMNMIIQSVMEVSHFLTLVLSDRVVTYTRDYATHSKLLGVWRTHTHKNIIPIVPPIPVSVSHPRVIARLKRQIGDSDITIGVAARLATEKGIEYLLEAIPVMQSSMKGKTIQIVIAGPEEPVGEQAYQLFIRSMVKRYKKSVIFLGCIDPKDMGSFYRCIDVLVVPSINSTEAFGMVQVEAMMCGVPVVASNLPGVRVPVQKTGMGMVVPIQDARAIAHAIKAVALHKDRYRISPSRVQALFSYPRSIARFFTVLC